MTNDFRTEMRGSLLRISLIALINCFGLGMDFSVFAIYLQNIRGFSITFSTVLFGDSSRPYEPRSSCTHAPPPA